MIASGWLSVDEAGGLVDAAPALRVRELVRRFWPYARPYRRWLVLGGVVVAVIPALDTVSIWLWKLLVDDVLVARDFGPFPLIAVGYVALTLAGSTLGFLDDYLATWIGERFVLDVRTALFEHLERLSPAFFERRRLGDVVSRLTGDVGSIETLVLSGVTDAASHILRIAFFSAALFYIQWQLALAALLVGPPSWYVARRFATLRRRAARAKRRRSGAVSAVAEEALSHIALVQAYGRERHESQRLRGEGDAALRAQLASTRIKGVYGALVELIELAGALVVFGVGTWLLAQGRLTLGALLAFLVYLVELYRPIRSMSRLTTSLFSASAGAERIAEFLDERPAVTEPARPRPLSRPRGVVAFEHVTFSYPGAPQPALVDVSFGLAPGQVVALVGPSGAGKSTIAKLLMRFYDPDVGAVRLDGHDLRELRVADVRAAVAPVLQEALILDGTIAENIAYGRAGASAAQIAAAAREADLHELVARLPGGYDELVGQKGRRLSGGQRQRLALARALVRDAPVLVLDEPATGLDAESSARILEALRRVRETRATLVIAHNLLTVRDASAILVVDEGRIVARGHHEELLAECELYARLWALHGTAAAVAA